MNDGQSRKVYKVDEAGKEPEIHPIASSRFLLLAGAPNEDIVQNHLT